MQYPDVNREELENLLLKMQQELMNKIASGEGDDPESDDMCGAGDEAVESTIQSIREHFGLKKYPFSGCSWWEKPKRDIADRLERNDEIQGVLR